MSPFLIGMVVTVVFLFCLPPAQVIVRQALKVRGIRRRQFWPSWQELAVAGLLTAALTAAMYWNHLFD